MNSCEQTFQNESQTVTQTQLSKENAHTKRIKSIDRFRGFCVFAMLVFQFLEKFPSLGFLSRLANHGLDNGIVILPGMTLADIIAPCFIFAIGLTYALSFNKWRSLYGSKSAYLKYALRALSIVGVGAILETCNKVVDSFGDYRLDGVDIMFVVLLSIALAALVFRLVCIAPKINAKVTKISSLTL